MKVIRGNILLILLLIIAIFLTLRNYTPNTFLSGWDTLHPEFNFGLAFEREINGVFRSEQGLGAVAGHSHMADLPRVLILYLLHFIFPTDTLRYLYIFLNLILGPIGMYFFLYKIVLKDKISAFLGGLFYLLSLGTMQQFVVPFEMFTTQYALLPWIFLFATAYLSTKQNSRRSLLLFSATTLLATPMAYAATLWYVYFFVFASYIFCLSLLNRSFQALKKSFVLVILTLAINLFWILPNIYFVLNHGKEVSEALINKLFSPQAFLYNKEFGNLKDIALMKSFLFDWNVYVEKSNFIHLLSPWITHLNQKAVQIIGFLLAIMSFSGVLYAILKKNKILLPFLPALIFCLFFLINNNPPTSFLYNFLENKIPLFKEAFRFPDDKILGIFTFVFAIYFAQGQKVILKFLKNNLKIAYSLTIFLLIIYYALPAFKGNFISPYMRIQIPKDYFRMFDWFDNQEETARVANLPIHSVWGWKYYRWGFQGADFLQFGIKQPLLDRDFDRWSPYNEQYYREMSKAIYSQDSVKFKNVLKKYDIGYVFLDKSIIAPEQGMNSQVLFFNETENLLAKNRDIQQVFNSGNLFAYRVNTSNQKVRTIENPISVGPKTTTFYNDFAYSKYNDYITYSDPKKNTVILPFRNLINNENRILPRITFPPYFIQEKQYIIDPSVNPTNNCPILTSDKSKSQMEVLGDSGKFLRYSSFSGPLCNYYSFPNIPREQGYSISVTSRNMSGLPLKLCVRSYISKRCDLFTQLSSFPTFTKETFLLPPMEKGAGFDIEFNNFAIEKSPSINDLSAIDIVPLPYTEFSQIEQYNPASKSGDSSFIVLSESFDPGWKAYQTNFQFSIFNFQLQNVFPFFFGKELKEHVMVNNWANGWLLGDPELKIKNLKLIIIFWPQYLEHLGFLILGATFTVIPIISLKKKFA